MKQCPFCAESIPPKARICKHCNSDLDADSRPTHGNSSSSNKSVIIVIVCVVAGLGVSVIAVLIALLLPAVQQARNAARLSQCRNNMKQIGLALHTYAEIYGTFPPAFTVDANGKPLHSWRVLILPYLDADQIYERIDLSQPWDSPVNAVFHQQMPPAFRCPSNPEEGQSMTHYLAIVGSNCVLRPGNMPSCKYQEVTDGLSNTILVSESMMGVNWMAPQDIPLENVNSGINPQGISTLHVPNSYVQVLIGDGSVHRLANKSPQQLYGLCTADGGETVFVE